MGYEIRRRLGSHAELRGQPDDKRSVCWAHGLDLGTSVPLQLPRVRRIRFGVVPLDGAGPQPTGPAAQASRIGPAALSPEEVVAPGAIPRAAARHEHPQAPGLDAGAGGAPSASAPAAPGASPRPHRRTALCACTSRLGAQRPTLVADPRAHSVAVAPGLLPTPGRRFRRRQRPGPGQPRTLNRPAGLRWWLAPRVETQRHRPACCPALPRARFRHLGQLPVLPGHTWADNPPPALSSGHFHPARLRASTPHASPERALSLIARRPQSAQRATSADRHSIQLATHRARQASTVDFRPRGSNTRAWR